ncbi:uncharacterized protein LOC134833713 [Culicoides brevitarsis]|uniref:uncharacterized protein LOC134833713 n=1 Tax=Culicoides brevitarsis TaxID=469753 RepID=UPI00307BF1F4
MDTINTAKRAKISEKCENIMDLNDDCWLCILRFFEILELMELRGICCRLDHLILQSCKSFGTLIFKDLPETLKAKFMEVLQFLGPAVKSLSMRGFDESYLNVEPSVILEWIDTHCINLETFFNSSIDLRESTAIQRFSSLVKRLKSLTLSNMCDDSLSNCFVDTSLDKLEVIDNENVTENFFKHVSNLKSLKIFLCDKISPNSCIEVLRNNLKVQTLSVCFYDPTIEGNDTLLSFITSNLHEIEDLEFGSLYKNTYRLAELPKLRKMAIGQTKSEVTVEITQEINSLIEKLSQKNIIEDLSINGIEGHLNMDFLCQLTNLKKLFLNGGEALTDAEMKKLQKLPNLESLTLWEVENLSSILTLIKNSQKLQHFEIECNNINVEFVDQLIQLLIHEERPKLTFVVPFIFIGQQSERHNQLLVDNKNIINLVTYSSDIDDQYSINEEEL